MARTVKQKQNKIRLSIPLSEDIYKKIEADADIVGVSMATYAAMIIGNHYRTQQISLDYANNNMIEAMRSLLEPIAKAKGLNYDDLAKESIKKAEKDTLESVRLLVQENDK